MADDKLSLINSQLAETGDAFVAVEDDGSDEWNATSTAYDTGVELTVERGNWNFGTNVATLQRVGASPDVLYDDAFAKPNACLHLIWVRCNDLPIDYKIINNLVCLSAQGGAVTVEYMVSPGVQNWPPLFKAVIRLLVRAAIYRGLHEDAGQADKEEMKANAILNEARTRVDQEGGKRVPFISRAIDSRRIRRPYVRRPLSNSGTGAPD